MTFRLLSTTVVALALAGAAQAAPPAIVASTRALSHYHRDDAAPGGVTQITLDVTRVAAQSLSQNVFGNFIENLRTVIYDTLWADALHNPQLERTEPAQAQPPSWDLTGDASWQEAPGSGYLSRRCVRLTGLEGALSQRVFLPATREREYTLTYWTRAPAGVGRLMAALRTGGEGEAGFQPGFVSAGQVIVQSARTVSGDAWQEQTLHWELPAGALPKGQASRLVIAHAGGQPVDVDDVELFPDDAVDGFDPDVLRAARAWDIPILRWSGNYSSGYDWRNGVGPRAARPSFRNYAWGGMESNAFGTDEFLTLARLIGAKTQIGVNAGDGTPALAADWVRYCDTHAPHPVDLWEIGNELYGDWQIGHTDAAGYADRFVRFRRAMLAADPSLQIMATGKGDQFDPDGQARNKAWNDAVLRAAVANGGPAPNYLTIHPLVPLPGSLGDLPYADQYESAMAQPAFLDQTELPALIKSIRDAEGPAGPTRIAPTEWGIILGGDRWQQGPNHNVLAGAVFSALTLNTYLRNGDWVTLANATALLHGGCIKREHGIVYVEPQYYTEQLYALARPSLPISVDWTGPGRDVPRRGFLPAVRDVSDVDVFAALTEDRTTLVVFLVNRRQTDTRAVHLALVGLTPGARSATILAAAAPQADNGWRHPDAVRPTPFALPPPTDTADLDFTLPPHSLVVLSLTRR